MRSLQGFLSACFLVVIVRSSPPPDYNHRPEFSSDWNSSATRLHRWDNEWDYVDLAFKVDFTALTGPGQHLLNGVFLGHTIARETFATQFILDVHRSVNVSTRRLFVHNVTPAAHHFEDAARHVMVQFRMYSASANTTVEAQQQGKFDTDDPYIFSAAGGPGSSGSGGGSGSSGNVKDAERNPAYARGSGYEEDLTKASEYVKWAEDATWRLGNPQGDLSLVEALSELSDQAQNKDSLLLSMGKVTRAVDPQWGLISLDWDLSLRLAYTVGVIDGSLRGSESYVASPDGGSDGGGGGTGGGDNETTSSRGFAAGGGSGGGTATGEVEKYSDVLWLNQGADRYCVEEERAPLSYGVPRGERSAYCEFEYFFREDVATALNVTTSRVQMLLIKAASRDHSLVYFRLLPPMTVNETSTHFLIADLQDQTQRLDSSLYNGNVTVRVDSSWGVSGFGRKVRQRTPYLPYDVNLHSSLGHMSSYERCKVTRRCPRAKEHYNLTSATKRFTYQTFDGGRHYEQSATSHLPTDPAAIAAMALAAAPAWAWESAAEAATAAAGTTGGSLSGGGKALVLADLVGQAYAHAAALDLGMSGSAGDPLAVGGAGAVLMGREVGVSSTGLGPVLKGDPGLRLGGTSARVDSWRVETLLADDDGGGGGALPTSTPTFTNATNTPTVTPTTPQPSSANSTNNANLNNATDGALAGRLGGSGGRVGLFADFEDWRVGTHGWRQRGGAPPRDPLLPPRGAHFAPLAFSPLGPAVAAPPPAGREAGEGRGAQRQSGHGTVTDSHLHYGWNQAAANEDDLCAEAGQCKPSFAYEDGNGSTTRLQQPPQDFDRFQNRGLVLNNRTLARDLQTQRRLLRTLENDKAWHVANRQTALMDAELRSRLDVDRFMTSRIRHIDERIAFETQKTFNLSMSQCETVGQVPTRQDGCRLLFNTSDATLRGAINVRGVVAKTPGGQPCAVFTFDAIEIGPEVNVTLVGQRPLVLLSRSSVVLNTTFQATPGTLGGFRGGFSWGRRLEDALSDDPEDLLLRHLPTMRAERPRPNFLEDDDDVSEKFRAAFAPSSNLEWGEDTESRATAQTFRGGSNETTAGNNVNGPGSGSVRNYQYTVTTEADDVDEVQVVTSTADPEQQLGGFWRLHYLGGRFSTQRIPWDASAAQVQARIENDLNPVPLAELPRLSRTPSSVHGSGHGGNNGNHGGYGGSGGLAFLAGVGAVNVTRGAVSSVGGYTWTITFATATGDVPQLEVTNLLSGMGSGIKVETATEGNSIRGTFALSMFGLRTEPIAHDASALEVKQALEASLSPKLLRAHVWRNDWTGGHCDQASASSRPPTPEYMYSDLDGRRPTNNNVPSTPPPLCPGETPLPLGSRCNDGFCLEGPRHGGGFTWTLLLTTLEGNVSPLSPTSDAAFVQAKRDELEVYGTKTAFDVSGTPTLTGLGVSITVRRGHGFSPLDVLTAFVAEEPFSLAYGGGGAGFGGSGGLGFNGSVPTGHATRKGQPYGDSAMSGGHLLGGSGGQLGYVSPHDIATFTTPTSRGGEGGGAIEVVAVNDLTVGSMGRLSANGGRGRDGHRGGGGGGSGGSVLLVAGGTVHLEGGARVEVRGGDGGRTGGQPYMTSRGNVRRYGGGADGFTAGDFNGSPDDGSGEDTTLLFGNTAASRAAAAAAGEDLSRGDVNNPGRALPATLNSKQERQLANLAKSMNSKKGGPYGPEKTKNKNSGESARHLASMRAKMLKGVSFTEAHRLAKLEETSAQTQAEIKTAVVERPGGGGAGGRVAVYAHAVSLMTQRALLRTDWSPEEVQEEQDLLSGGGIWGSNDLWSEEFKAKRNMGEDRFNEAKRNGGDGGQRLDSGWRPRDGARGSGSNQRDRRRRGGTSSGGEDDDDDDDDGWVQQGRYQSKRRGGEQAGSDGSPWSEGGSGMGFNGYAVYDVGGGRCVQRTWHKGPANGTWVEPKDDDDGDFDIFGNSTNSSSSSGMNSTYSTNYTVFRGSIVYLGPNETAFLCDPKRQGSPGSFHLEVDVDVAVQVVERGVDDYADAEEVEGVNSTAAHRDRSPSLQPGGGGGSYAQSKQAGSDFDKYAGSSGGAQGTRRALRLDSSFSGRAVTSSGVSQRRPFPFSGLEHDLLGASASAAAATTALLQAAEALERSQVLNATAELLVKQAKEALEVHANFSSRNASQFSKDLDPASPNSTMPNVEALAFQSAASLASAATEAQAAANAAHLAAKKAADLAARASGPEFRHRGTHRPSRISFYLKVNGSDFFSDRHRDQFTPDEPSKRRQGSWGALVALHSSDYGRRTGYDGRGSTTAKTRTTTSSWEKKNETTASGASSSSSADTDPYARHGYFAHTYPGIPLPSYSGQTPFSEFYDSWIEDKTANNSTNTTGNATASAGDESSGGGGGWRKLLAKAWEEKVPRALVGVSVGSDMRHGTDFLVTPTELVHPVATQAAAGDTDPQSFERRTSSGALHDSSPGDGFTGNLPVFKSSAQEHRWYKFDLFLDWERHLYSIRVDDERVVDGAPFSADHSQALRLGVYVVGQATVHVDEIFVGPDTTRQFETPVVTRTGVDMARPRQSNGWSEDDIGGVSTLHPMTRHENHLSKRPVYQFDNTMSDFDLENGKEDSANPHGGVRRTTPFDGDGHRKFHSDVKERRPRGHVSHGATVTDVEGSGGLGADGGGGSSNPAAGNGPRVSAGQLLYVKGERAGPAFLERSATSVSNDLDTARDGRVPREVGQSWSYSAQDRRSSYSGYLDGSSDLQEPRNAHHSGSTGRYYWYGEHHKGPTGEAADGSGFGGVYCMSTADMTTWRNEGLMLDFRNLTDMVNGEAPIGAKLVVDRPKVLFNNLTQLYVMYMHLEYAHDTDPTEDNSVGGYAQPLGDAKHQFEGENSRWRRTAFDGSDGATKPATPGGVGSAVYPGSSSPLATASFVSPHANNGQGAEVGFGPDSSGAIAGFAAQQAQLQFEAPGTDGGLTVAGSTWGSAPGGMGSGIRAWAGSDAADVSNRPSERDQGWRGVKHSDRGVDGLGSGVGKGLDEEEGHFQEHKWVRRKSLRGNWTGTQLGMAAVATSKWPNGPFDFRRSFYPDGNKTKDQTVFAPAATGHISRAAMASSRLRGANNDRVDGKQLKDDGSGDPGVHRAATEKGGDNGAPRPRPIPVDPAAVDPETSGAAFLGRTYYASTEFVLPAAVMQPVWESVKNASGAIDFALSYHRSFYESEYDKFHDIYLQRWRLEDKAWRVVCVNRSDGSTREVEREGSGGWATHAASTTPGTAWELPEGAVCHDPDEYKVILGQGYPAIPSRFLDPRDPKNNDWRPSSVPAVQSQPWWYNYRNGQCGIRKLDDDLDPNDPLLERNAQGKYAKGGNPEWPNTTASARQECSDIADNPLHGTLADLLNGPLAVVETRRAKYVAVSRLSDDYLDTSSLLTSFEGELEDEKDMVHLLTSFGGSQFGWAVRGGGSGMGTFGEEAENGEPGSSVGRSTFQRPVDSSEGAVEDGSGYTGDTLAGGGGEFTMDPDSKTRLHQFEEAYGDRSEFSLACVLDGTCGVNFKDQVQGPSLHAEVNSDEAQGHFDLFSGSPTTGSQDFRSSFNGR